MNEANRNDQGREAYLVHLRRKARVTPSFPSLVASILMGCARGDLSNAPNTAEVLQLTSRRESLKLRECMRPLRKVSRASPSSGER